MLFEILFKILHRACVLCGTSLYELHMQRENVREPCGHEHALGPLCTKTHVQFQQFASGWRLYSDSC